MRSLGIQRWGMETLAPGFPMPAKKLLPLYKNYSILLVYSLFLSVSAFFVWLPLFLVRKESSTRLLSGVSLFFLISPVSITGIAFLVTSLLVPIVRVHLVKELILPLLSRGGVGSVASGVRT